VRKALHLSKREKIRYTIQPDGKVLLSRVDQDEPDPALSSFLRFLASDIQKNPQRLQAVTPDLVSRVQNLISHVELDLDANLDDEDE
jgi:antitoxin PrlF